MTKLGAIGKLSAWCLLATCVWSCGGGGGGGSATTKPTVRFFNAISDSTAVDFNLNDTVYAPSVAYQGSSANFQGITPNTYDVVITEHGQTESLWSITDNLKNNTDTAVIAFGEETYGTENLKRPQILALPVNRAAPIGTKAQLYIVNAFEEDAGFPTPAIDFTNPGDNPQFSALAIAPGSASPLLVDAGNQDFLVRQNGSQGNFVEKTLTLASGSVYLIIVCGVDGGFGTNAPSILQIPLQTK